MKTAIIDVGGGMRGCYGAGVVEYLLDNDIHFDIGIGVSAGSSNLVTLKSEQKGRLRRFYEVYPKRKEYMGIREYLRHGSFFNVKYIFEDLSMKGMEDEVDIARCERNPMQFYLVATDAETGKPVYFHPDTFVPAMHEASCNLPVLNKAVSFDGHEYYDGGVSDPIPWKKAFELGAEKLVVVLTKPETEKRDPKRDEGPAKLLARKYPEAGKALALRAETYNRQIDEITSLRNEGKLIIVSPDDTCGVTTTRHKPEDVRNLYWKGYEDAAAIKDYLK